MLAQVAHGDIRNLPVGDDPGRGAREQHLAPVSNRADSRRSVDTYADVALIGNVRLTGMQPHPDANLHSVVPWVRGERPLRRDGGRDCLSGPRERDEEAVTLCVDFDAAVLGERPTDEATMVGKNVAVA